MNDFIAQIDYFNPDSWRVLAAPYAGRNPESSRANIEDVADKLGEDGIALLVGSLSVRTANKHKRKLLGAVRCYRALYRTEEVVDARYLGSDTLLAPTILFGCHIASPIRKYGYAVHH